MPKKINSRQKGARGEREWASFLRDHGLSARRGQQFAGGKDSPDVVCEELADHVHFEVKRTERLDLYGALSQAKGDGGDKLSIVAHRKNDSEWVLIIPADKALPIIIEKFL